VLTVVLCSIGRRVELTRHFVASVRRLAPPGSKVIGLDVDPLAPALRFADEAVLVPRVSDSRFVEVLTAVLDGLAEQRVLVVPLSDREVGPLAALAEAGQRPGLHFSVVPTQAVSIVEDKWETMRFFESLDLPTPRSWLPEDDLGSLPYPVFAKPRRGSAGEGGVRLKDHRWLELMLPDIESPIVQELMIGDEITTDVICGLDGRFLTAVSRRRIQVRGGEVMKAVTVSIPEIDTACRSIAQALPARGPITVQAFEHPERGYLFSEINARLGGGSPLAVAAGVPLTDLLVLEALGEPRPLAVSYVEGVTMTRFDESVFLSKGELGAIPYRDLRSG
jgi:carbamoyl-phosphate synthase large subunit